jgi:hypothetical protein
MERTQNKNGNMQISFSLYHCVLISLVTMARTFTGSRYARAGATLSCRRFVHWGPRPPHQGPCTRAAVVGPSWPLRHGEPPGPGAAPAPPGLLVRIRAGDSTTVPAQWLGPPRPCPRRGQCRRAAEPARRGSPGGGGGPRRGGPSPRGWGPRARKLEPPTRAAAEPRKAPRAVDVPGRIRGRTRRVCARRQSPRPGRRGQGHGCCPMGNRRDRGRAPAPRPPRPRREQGARARCRRPVPAAPRASGAARRGRAPWAAGQHP